LSSDSQKSSICRRPGGKWIWALFLTLCSSTAKCEQYCAGVGRAGAPGANRRLVNFVRQVPSPVLIGLISGAVHSARGGKPEGGSKMKIFVLGNASRHCVPPVQAWRKRFDEHGRRCQLRAKCPRKPDVSVLKDGMYTCKTCAPATQQGRRHGPGRHGTSPISTRKAIKVVDDHTIR